MCLILFSWDPAADFPLVVAANRDEFYARPALPADFWEENSEILAGKDLEAGGTWLGIAKNGRWAALTNYRNFLEPPLSQPRSRGGLATHYLQGSTSPEQYARQVWEEGHLYNGFNLLMGTKDELWYVSNRGNGPQSVAPGIHGLCNHLLNTPWPKVERGKDMFAQQMSRPIDLPALLDMMQDAHRAADQDLPSTGVSLELERMLSSMFISSEKYGTRCSTALSLDSQGNVQFMERQHHPKQADTIYGFRAL